MGALSNHPESLDGQGMTNLLGVTGHDINLQNSTSFCQSDGNCISAEDMRNNMDASASESLEKGHMQYGCPHYRRRCCIRSPCCNEIFDCRHCHNEAKVICSLCGTEQEVQQVCINCGVCMGKYFCNTCKLFDDISKQQYHCNGCGICRIGGRENFFHCYTCVSILIYA